MSADGTRGRGRRLVLHLLWCVAAAAVPLAAALALRGLLAEREPRTVFQQVSVIAGAAVGLLIGARTGRLIGWVFGPAVGCLAGYLDFRTFALLLDPGHLSVRAAALVPVWGAVAGALAGLSHRRPGFVLLTVLTVAAADCVARWGWLTVAGSDWLGGWQRHRWLLESLVYVPPAVAAVGLTAGRQVPGKTASTPS